MTQTDEEQNTARVIPKQKRFKTNYFKFGRKSIKEQSVYESTMSKLVKR